ncbi:bifunctional 4-hydroxy-2-oxoglutarate aldolase/2-dehydro-3-deoxy-phosphogluconate aldolase [Echinicola sp. 20G]|uniref:bifunctional 4-hydroxy-2-oxoglutarate aldolase/2-dehydro-3-deoxy-phosphogluconate aldolase n=1 Tax=Echinicola sp. 20G TaxID=2781961 RepID=UPI00190FFE52|nr:bifunctional 4-hydroxy-2-oxoglutarate aldolase/2-dehydro-3-deoxy-phosphogluconate aldolase [Echinicola sp. 20G]
MNRKEIRQIILQEKLIAILRSKNTEEMATLVSGLVAGGVKVLEVTSNSKDFEKMIAENRQRFPDVLIGAGTIINGELARQSVAAGAQFLVSPNTNAEVIAVAHVNDIPVVMGALTPTEIGEALDRGADVIKLFPAGNFGPGYLKAIKAPFDQAPVFAVGGIHLDNLEEWMDAGADGLGLGSVLTQFEEEQITEALVAGNARKFIEKMKRYA